MSDPKPNDDLRLMQARLVADYLELATASGSSPHPDCLTVCAILAHPDTVIRCGGE